MTATTTDLLEEWVGHDRLVARLCDEVRDVLAERADAVRSALPPRPSGARDGYRWWRALDEEQARRAALMERLDALCAHLAGHPALGYDPADPLPGPALEEADGFASESTAVLIRAYRRTCG